MNLPTILALLEYQSLQKKTQSYSRTVGQYCHKQRHKNVQQNANKLNRYMLKGLWTLTLMPLLSQLMTPRPSHIGNSRTPSQLPLLVWVVTLPLRSLFTCSIGKTWMVTDRFHPIVSEAPCTLWGWDLLEETGTVLSVDNKAFCEHIMTHNIMGQSGQQPCFHHFRGPNPQF